MSEPAAALPAGGGSAGLLQVSLREHGLGPWDVTGPDGRSVTAAEATATDDLGFAADVAGPYGYRCTTTGLAVGTEERILLDVGAASYDCVVRVDGRQVGHHRGSWDRFWIDLTDVLGDGASHELIMEVEKPASLTAGPDSPPVAGRFPTRAVLSGFLPYVWGHLHGGVWQPARLLVVADPMVLDLVVRLDGDEPAGGAPTRDRVRADVVWSAPARGRIVIATEDGRPLVSAEAEGQQWSLVLPADGLPRWSPEQPQRVTVRVECAGRPRAELITGLRRLSVDGSSILLDDQPCQPRMILSWGWYPDRRAPTPSPEQVRDDLLRLRGLGFNGVKACLWVPPEDYLRVADELGMLVWLELPLWLPQPGDGFATQALAEMTEIVRAARRHPSVIVYTLGCELSEAADVRLLTELFATVRALAGDALLNDNSGSAEAYGGVETGLGEFADHHLYADPEFLPGLLDHFALGWRPPRPWLFGEFGDLDAYRDPAELRGWWWADPAQAPQGARWQYDLPDLPGRLASWRPRADELVAAGRAAAVLHRQLTLEAVRCRTDTTGYVITGERDTPISTSGIFDDRGEVRLDAAALRQCNGPTAVMVVPPRRRRWISGGDRPAPVDPWCHTAGTEVRLHLVVDHHAPATVGTLTWALGEDTGTGVVEVCAGRHAAVEMRATLPKQPGPVPLAVRLELASGASVEAGWDLWAMPDPWPGLGPVAAVDPDGRLAGLARLLGREPAELADSRIAVATRWTSGLDAWTRAGGRVVLLAEPGCGLDLPLIAEPFWREAVRLAEPDPLWGHFPHRGITERQFLCCSTDHSLDPTGARIRPLLSRLDTRTGRTHLYAGWQSLGAGGRLVTTLRPDGGRGNQPVGLAANPGGSALLGCWLHGLAGADGPQG